MRYELKKRGIKKLKVVYSKEEPLTPLCEDKRTPASLPFVPAACGFIIAGEVFKDLTTDKNNI
jgi:tRNA A37 threonylcarbamoyladenosine dehydratase